MKLAVKITLCILLMCVASSFASANMVEDGELVVCQNPKLDLPKRGNRGFSVEFKKSGNKTYATLKKIRYTLFSKSKRVLVLATLPCEEVKPENPAPDLPQEVLECQNPATRDTGYHVGLTSGDFTGKFFAKISKLSIIGKELKATEPCKRYKAQE